MTAPSDLPVNESEERNRQVPLVFFYSGQSLPGYCYDALRHAISVWGQGVVLLTDVPNPRIPVGLNVVDYQRWFQPESFEATVAQSGIDSHFRSGFWSATLKRFFVLHQYMEAFKLEKVAHAELDSVIFARQEDLFTATLPYPGLFIPWNPPHLAIGSLVLVNGIDSIRSLISFAEGCQGFSNEMELLTSFLGDPTRHGFGLPTADALMYPGANKGTVSNLLTEEQLGWRFDAARLGQWVLGIEPRNQRSVLPRNHFAEPGMAPTRVGHDRKTGNPIIWTREQSTPSNLANIHVHSKRIRQATHPLRRLLWFALANLPFRSFVGINTSRIRKRCGKIIGLMRTGLLKSVGVSLEDVRE